MKRLLQILFVFLITAYSLRAQNVGINSTGAAPAPSAILDLNASPGNDKGFLVPRMTGAEMNAIAAPATGLMIFNTDCSVFDYWTGSKWVSFPTSPSVPSAINAGASPNPICPGNLLSFTGTATGATTWDWEGPNGFSSALQNPTLAITTTLQTGTYTLTTSNACGLSNSSTVSVTVNSGVPTGVIAAASPNPICTGNLLSFTGTATNATSWSWTGPDGFTSALQNPTLAISTTLQAGTYSLTTSNSCGSSTTGTVAVAVGAAVHGTQTFSYTGAAIQTFIVPSSCEPVTIEVRGAAGGTGGYAGGLGAKMVGTFALATGQQLDILVGQQGSSAGFAGSGGGGSFVVDHSSGNPLIVAGGGGGGGGGGAGASGPGDPGLTTTTGATGNLTGGASGGSLGGGGGGGEDGGLCYGGGGGGGFYGNGGNGSFTSGAGSPGSGGTGSTGPADNGGNATGTGPVCLTGGGESYTNGGAGGVNCAGSCGTSNGGYGGGGGASGSGGGGGGGYSGGGGSGIIGGNTAGGGGGGSYTDASATGTSSASGFQAGNGEVILTW